MENNNQQEEMEQLTPEELAARKEEMKSFFDESIPYLKSQLEYETMLSQISEHKFKRFQWDTQLAMAMHQMQNPEEYNIDTPEEDNDSSVKKRKLRKN